MSTTLATICLQSRAALFHTNTACVLLLCALLFASFDLAENARVPPAKLSCGMYVVDFAFNVQVCNQTYMPLMQSISHVRVTLSMHSQMLTDASRLLLHTHYRCITSLYERFIGFLYEKSTQEHYLCRMDSNGFQRRERNASKQWCEYKLRDI